MKWGEKGVMYGVVDRKKLPRGYFFLFLQSIFMKERRLIVFCTALMLWMLPGVIRGQVTIDALRLPSDVCAGDVTEVRMGYGRTNEVVVGRKEASLGHSDRIFLPDGAMCDGSCSYRSPVTFTVFADTARIRSVQDIKYVRLKMEHSYIGDIYINVTCPNGQKADLMRFSGSGTSSCDDVIPQGSRSWLSGNNISENTFFGMARDEENSNYPCDAWATGNEAGTGWNYCWSNNSNSGYGYASGDGIVYRYGHAHGGRVDSSDVAGHRNFYHPDESFDKLRGCPLNGTWFVEVVDGYSIDNGYIFEWELALDASLIPNSCFPESYFVEGGETVRVDDSTFRLVAPGAVWNDTAVTYRFGVVTSCGDTVDTTATIRYHTNRESDTSGAICEGDLFVVGGYAVEGAGSSDVHLRTTAGCDSTVHVSLTVYPTYDFHTVDSTCVNVPYVFEGASYGEAGVYPHVLTTAEGCDSVHTLHLSISSQNLKARIKAVPLVVDDDHQEMRLEDVSRNHVDSRWLIEGAEYHERKLTITYPVEYDSLPIMLEAVSEEGCYDTATAMARYDRATLFVPNAFTPSRGENDVWRPMGYELKEVEVWIYNREGLLVAHLEGLDAVWDGEGCPAGAYVYTVHYRTLVRPEWKQVRTGTVLLIR